jgi:hypothetical protein
MKLTDTLLGRRLVVSNANPSMLKNFKCRGSYLTTSLRSVKGF